MIFVDTGPWFALFVPNDSDHGSAKSWYETNTEPLVTSDYVVDEVLTLFKVRGELRRGIEVGRRLLEEEISELEWVTKIDVKKAWALFQSHDDKGWSFTDCVSRVMMERLGIKTAFSFDDHFRQFGTVTVVP